MKLPEMVRILANLTRFELEKVTVWYSFTTPVAFQRGDGPLIVRENQWGNTTGRHLKRLDGGDKGYGGEAEASR